MAGLASKSEGSLKSLQKNSRNNDTTKTQPQPKRNMSFERNYQTLINKQLIEVSCNAEEVKRQLHIFMPTSAKSLLCDKTKGKVQKGGSKGEEDSDVKVEDS